MLAEHRTVTDTRPIQQVSPDRALPPLWDGPLWDEPEWDEPVREPVWRVLTRGFGELTFPWAEPMLPYNDVTSTSEPPGG